MKRRAAFVAAAALLAVVTASCGGSGSGGGSGDDVAITLKEFSVAATPSSFAPGDVTFAIQNDGSVVHEFVVLKTDDAPDALPVENGVVPEDQVDLIDEAEDIAPGTSTSLTVNLAAGSYVLVCNLPAHYEAGMHTSFTVG